MKCNERLISFNAINDFEIGIKGVQTTAQKDLMRWYIVLKMRYLRLQGYFLGFFQGFAANKY